MLLTVAAQPWQLGADGERPPGLTRVRPPRAGLRVHRGRVESGSRMGCMLLIVQAGCTDVINDGTVEDTQHTHVLQRHEALARVHGDTKRTWRIW
jgi:hypothetical protein